MPLTLTVTSYQRLSPGQEVTKVADRQSVSIGRAQGNDWVLPDPERYLSGRHCLIEYRDDGYYLTDTSTNGVFINDRQQRVGRGQSVKLKDGDLLILGEYEIEASLPPEQPAPAPAAGDLFGDETLNSPVMGTTPAPPDRLRETGAPPPPEDEEFLPEHTDPLGLSWSGAAPGQPRRDDGSTADHVPDEQSFFRPPDMAREVIPEEWDDEWLGPEPPPRDTPPAQRRQAPPGTGTRERPPPEGRTPEGRTPEGRTPEGRTPEGRTPEGRTPEGRTTEGRTTEGKATGAALDLIPEDLTLAGRPPDAPPPEPQPVMQPKPPPEPKPAPPRERRAAASPAGDHEPALLRAFLRGAGMENLHLPPQEAEARMEMMGVVFRQMVQGLMEALAARRQIKNEFRLSQTTIRPVENNPFKFSLGVDDAIATLLTKRGPAYLAPEKAVQEGFRDMKAHEVAVMAGTQAALSHLLRRFDPKSLEERLGQQSMLANLLPGMRKAKYWDVFRLLYEEIAREAEDDFQELFGREFARAYEEQVRKL